MFFSHTFSVIQKYMGKNTLYVFVKKFKQMVSVLKLISLFMVQSFH